MHRRAGHCTAVFDIDGANARCVRQHHTGILILHCKINVFSPLPFPRDARRRFSFGHHCIYPQGLTRTKSVAMMRHLSPILSTPGRFHSFPARMRLASSRHPGRSQTPRGSSSRHGDFYQAPKLEFASTVIKAFDDLQCQPASRSRARSAVDSPVEGSVFVLNTSRQRLILSSYIIKTKIHSSCEVEYYYVETHLCKLCVILRSRVLRVVCPHEGYR